MRATTIRIILIIILALGLLVSLTAEEAGWQDVPGSRSRAAEIAASLTSEQLLGQVFMIGYRGPGADPAILEWIRDKGIGGVKVFGWNGDDLPALARSIGTMQRAAGRTDSGIPLFIATDQEGGWVRHVKGATSITPGNMSIGAGGLPYDAYRTGKLIGAELRTLGINMNFAPTVDVYTNPEAHVIGPRAFSSDPLTTAVMSQAYFFGMRSQGVVCTAKHFPGHGNADRDSHGALPIINDDLPVLMERELLPYRMLIPEGLPAVMTGHLAFPAISGDTVPASLSYALVTGILRQKLGFDGLVITDDLRMNGAQYSGEGIPRAAESALRAGNDMILISLDTQLHQRVWDHLRRILTEDPAFRARLVEAVTRILRTKEEYLTGSWGVPRVPDPEAIAAAIPADEAYLFEQACRAISSVATDTLPINSNESILLAGQLPGFFRAGEARFPDARSYQFAYDPFYAAAPGAAEAIAGLGASRDRIIFCLATPGSFAVLKELVRLAPEFKEKIVLVSVLTPVYLKQLAWPKAALAAFGTGDESFAAVFGALKGDFVPRGTLPLEGLKVSE